METKTEFKVGDHVAVEGYGGIAFYIYKQAKIQVPVIAVYDDEDGFVQEEIVDYELEDDPEHWICVMVGDDREYVVHPEEMTLIGEDDYCGGCGQIGCGW